MAGDKSDAKVLASIKQLVEEEHALRASKDADAQQKLEKVRVELDQCWDLLRQRRAMREFGEDPDKAQVRPANVVEGYKQ